MGREGRLSSDSDVACETSVEADPGSFEPQDSCRSSFERSPERGWHNSNAHETPACGADVSAQSTGALQATELWDPALSVFPPI